eukprot:gene6200-6436_t
MSVLLVLALLIAGDPGQHLWPEVSSAVQAVPTHGMVAMVLVWHERVESTVIRMVLRILGTALGATLGFAAMLVPSIASSPPLLLLIMAAVGMLLAPLASPSFHLRSAIIPEPNAANSKALVVHVSLLQVTVACVIAALFNNLILPWTSTDLSLENMASAYTAAAALLQEASDIQFAVYRQVYEAGRSGSSPDAQATARAADCAAGVHMKPNGQTSPAARESDQACGPAGKLRCSSTAGAATGADVAAADHWWVTAGENYMQQLAFQFAFDSAICEFMHAAKLALLVHEEEEWEH